MLCRLRLHVRECSEDESAATVAAHYFVCELEREVLSPTGAGSSPHYPNCNS
jgi:hypothetical protein